MKNILYIHRPQEVTGLRARISNWYSLNYFAQSGFFRSSLHAVAKVTEKELENLAGCKKAFFQKFDAVVVDYKASKKAKVASIDQLSLLKKLTDIPKCLLVANAQAANLPRDEILDLFDVVFKREHYKDRDRYAISMCNKEKLHTTMLACPLINVNRFKARSFSSSVVGCAETSASQEFDWFFSGSATSLERVRIFQALKRLPFVYKGGLQAKPGVIETKKIFADLENPIPMRCYPEVIRNAKVNLALKGYGEFTFRHLEILALSSFLLCDAEINELELPIKLKDGRDYVGYLGLEDLAEKLDYFVRNDSARREIAIAGRKRFVEDYDFAKHGAAIMHALS